MKHKLFITSLIAAFYLGLATLGTESAHAGSERPRGGWSHHDGPRQPMTCEEIAGVEMQGLTIGVSEHVAADASVPIPAHCRVVGVLGARVGVEGKEYGMGFELRLPEEWNGRFLFQGGAGSDGVILPALGSIGNGQSSNALSEGYAVVSTDAGHRAEEVPVTGGALFAIDPKARVAYGYAAVREVAILAKELITRRYAQSPRYSYFIGCSNGGRQGMVAAERFPDLFDGIVSGNPGFNLPRAALQHPWDIQAFGEVAPQAADGRPILSRAFSDRDLMLVAEKVAGECDKLDGLVDGIIENQPACNFDPAVLQCSGDKTDTCLSASQVHALQKVFGGVQDSTAAALYSDWPYDTGIASPSWRVWKLGFSPTSTPDAIIATLGGGSLPYIFMTPPDAVAGATPDRNALAVYDYLLNFDFDSDAPRIYETSGSYRESAMEFMGAKPRLAIFRSLGHKLILYHGTSDPVFSVNDTINYYQHLARRNGGLRLTGKFAILFVVPGMTHCSGGPSTDGFNTLAPIVDWVEEGKVPDAIKAVARTDNSTPWPGRSRPLCPYPLQARYKGNGDIEEAENFRCQKAD